MIDDDSSRLWRKKYSELCSTHYGDLDVKSYPLKSTFTKNSISASKGCCAPKFFTRAREWLSLENRVLFTIFFSKGIKNWLKIWRICAHNFKNGKSKIMKLCHITCHMASMITNVQISGDTHPENLVKQKRQNLAQYRTTFEFNCECFRNRFKYQKSGTNLIKAHLCGV